jgi:hypothetical protein
MATIGEYRWKILPPPTVGGNGDLHFDLQVEICTAATPETWFMLEQGHYTLVMPGQVIIGISSAAGTTTQKRALVLAWITEQVKLRGVSLSDQARRSLIALLPGGQWPEVGVSASFVP